MNLLRAITGQKPAEAAPLTLEHARGMLKTLGTITFNAEEIANCKLSFADDEIAWGTSSGMARNALKIANIAGANKWSPALNRLPTLIGRIVEGYRNEMANLTTSQGADKEMILLETSMMGLKILNTCHYMSQSNKEANVQIIADAVERLQTLQTAIGIKKLEIERAEAPAVAPAPREPMATEVLKQRFEALKAKCEVLELRLLNEAGAPGQKKNFQGTTAYVEIFKASAAELAALTGEEVPEEIPEDEGFNALRRRFIQQVKLYAMRAAEAQGYDIVPAGSLSG